MSSHRCHFSRALVLLLLGYTLLSNAEEAQTMQPSAQKLVSVDEQNLKFELDEV